MSESNPAIVSVKPVILPAPGRGEVLQVRVSAPVTSGDLPVVVFSHGFGWSMNGYAPLADHWAAQGFVVIQPTHLDSRTLGIPHEDPRFARIWRIRIEDLKRVLDELAVLEASVPGRPRGTPRPRPYRRGRPLLGSPDREHAPGRARPRRRRRPRRGPVRPPRQGGSFADAGVPIAVGLGDEQLLRTGLIGVLPISHPAGALLKPMVLRARAQPVEADILVEDKFDLSPYGVDAHAERFGGHTPGALVVRVGDDTLVGDLVRGGVLRPRARSAISSPRTPPECAGRS